VVPRAGRRPVLDRTYREDFEFSADFPNFPNPLFSMVITSFWLPAQSCWSPFCIIIDVFFSLFSPFPPHCGWKTPRVNGKAPAVSVGSPGSPFRLFKLAPLLVAGSFPGLQTGGGAKFGACCFSRAVYPLLGSTTPLLLSEGTVAGKTHGPQQGREASFVFLGDV